MDYMKYNAITFDSDEAKAILTKLNLNLQEYVSLSKSMDELTYREHFKNMSQPMAMAVHQPLDGGINVYRTRLSDTISKDEDLTKPSTFSYIPKDKCTDTFPSLHRCNFSGQSIFYASMSMSTNFVELGLENCIGKTVYCSKWHVEESAYVHLFRVIPPEGVEITEDYNGFLRIPQDCKYPNELIDYLKTFGSIMMNTEGDDNEKYLPCALLSNYIYDFTYDGPKMFEHLESVYNGLIYPSVKYKDRTSPNFALKPDFVDNNLNLNCVIKGIVCDNIENVIVQEIGFNHDGTIVWYRTVENYYPTNFFFYDKKHVICNVEKGHLFDLNHKEIKDPANLFNENKIKEQIVNQVHASIENKKFDLNQIVDESSLKPSVLQGGFGIMLDGWTLEIDNEVIQIAGVDFEFEYIKTLEKI